MANVLDLRRRIRSVKNTRQITKAMKMVSAAKLRRAQERAMQARPYAQMLTNVLESLVRRTDLLQRRDRRVMHPLLVEREEKNVLVVVIAGDKGFAGGFNSNIGKAAQRFIDERRALGQNIDLEPIGKKAIGLYKRKYPAAVYEHKEELYDNDLSKHIENIRHRAQPIEVAAEHRGLCWSRPTSRRLRDGVLDHRPLRARRDRFGLSRLQRVQVGHLAARRRGEAAADPQARIARDYRGRRDDRGAEGSCGEGCRDLRRLDLRARRDGHRAGSQEASARPRSTTSSISRRSVCSAT